MAESRHATAWAFLLWSAAGAGGVLGLLTILTIGRFLLPLTALLSLAFLLWPRMRNESVIGVGVGLGGLVLYVAYLNRGGPGTVCKTTATSSSCVDEWSPWPWLVVGALLIVSSITLFVLVRRLRLARWRSRTRLH